MIQQRLRKKPSLAHVDMDVSITGCILAIIYEEEEEEGGGNKPLVYQYSDSKQFGILQYQ